MASNKKAAPFATENDFDAFVAPRPKVCLISIYSHFQGVYAPTHGREQPFALSVDKAEVTASSRATYAAPQGNLLAYSCILCAHITILSSG